MKRVGAKEMEFLVSRKEDSSCRQGALDSARCSRKACFWRPERPYSCVSSPRQAEDTLITIESRFRHPVFHFIKVTTDYHIIRLQGAASSSAQLCGVLSVRLLQGDFGPFVPMGTVEVSQRKAVLHKVGQKRFSHYCG